MFSAFQNISTVWGWQNMLFMLWPFHKPWHSALGIWKCCFHAVAWWFLFTFVIIFATSSFDLAAASRAAAESSEIAHNWLLYFSKWLQVATGIHMIPLWLFLYCIGVSIRVTATNVDCASESTTPSTARLSHCKHFLLASPPKIKNKHWVCQLHLKTSSCDQLGGQWITNGHYSGCWRSNCRCSFWCDWSISYCSLLAFHQCNQWLWYQCLCLQFCWLLMSHNSCWCKNQFGWIGLSRMCLMTALTACQSKLQAVHVEWSLMKWSQSKSYVV